MNDREFLRRLRRLRLMSAKLDAQARNTDGQFTTSATPSPAQARRVYGTRPRITPQQARLLRTILLRK